MLIWLRLSVAFHTNQIYMYRRNDIDAQGTRMLHVNSCAIFTQ